MSFARAIGFIYLVHAEPKKMHGQTSATAVRRQPAVCRHPKPPAWDSPSASTSPGVGEHAQERDGIPGQRFLYAFRLLRDPDRYISRFGQQNYDIGSATANWRVYRLLGKFAGYACTFTKPAQ